MHYSIYKAIPFENLSKGLQRALGQQSVPPRPIMAEAYGRDGRRYWAFLCNDGLVCIEDSTTHARKLVLLEREPSGLKWKAFPELLPGDTVKPVIRRWWMFWLR